MLVQFYLLINPLVPSGSPVMIDIEAINSSSLRLSWDEPPAEEQNGIIVSYSINVTVLESEEQLSFITEGTRFELYNLHPFYTYSVTMAAATVNGTGPYSTVFTVQLPPDGELQLHLNQHKLLLKSHS